jgi:uncharacterized protein (TIGR02246 family)
MKSISITRPALIALALAFPAMAQEQTASDAEKASKMSADAYVAAFNKGDAKALAAMYAEDAQYTSDEGTTVIGRPAVLNALTKFFEKSKGAQLSVKVESARFLTPDVLIEKGLATIGDETTRYVCNYVKKGGAWLISELNETTLPPVDAAAVALDELSWLIGSWKDNSPGIAVETTAVWTKNQHFLRRSLSIAREREDPIEATEIIGYDPVAGGIRSWVFDSEGGFGEGAWTREANKWLVAFKGTGPDGTTSTAQHVITFVDENKYTWESINRQREGEVLPNLDKVEVVRAAAQ